MSQLINRIHSYIRILDEYDEWTCVYMTNYSIFITEWPLLCVSLCRRVGGDNRTARHALQEPAGDRRGAAHGVSLSAERLSSLISLVVLCARVNGWTVLLVKFLFFKVLNMYRIFLTQRICFFLCYPPISKHSHWLTFALMLCDASLYLTLQVI